MRVIVAASVVAQLVVGAASPANAMSATDLLQSCEILVREARPTGGDRFSLPPGGLMCWYYMEAVQDAIVLGDENGHLVLRVCAPEETDQMQLVRIFVQYARQNPAQLHQSGVWVAQVALSRAFPCR
jgi:hypothetical protein